jgi:ribosomal protein S18 acetylase RimI-like enzyme
MPPAVVVRPATPQDLPTLGRLGAMLVRYHRDLDPRRFMDIQNVETGYARFLGSQLKSDDAVVLCAVVGDGRSPASLEPGRNLDNVVGYAYGTVEGRDWNALLDEHGALHDVIVDPAARRGGVGEALVLEMCRRLEALGAPRVVLHTAVQNAAAQKLFAKLGFRSTMIEMTRESGGG